MFDVLCTFFAISIVTWYLYYRYCFNYWKSHGVPTLQPSFPAGNITKSVIGKESIFVTVEKLYNEFKRKGHKHGGLYFFNGPVYFPIDPEIIKSILATDFEHFVDRGMFSDEKKYPLSAHLFTITGFKWRILRTKLSPLFTSGKLKAMYEVFLKTVEHFINTVEPVARRDGEVNIKYVASNFTADIICSTAFGFDANTLENPDNEVSKIALNMFNPSSWLLFKMIVSEGLSNPGSLLKATLSMKNVENFFVNLVKELVKLRSETTLPRKDFFSLILDVKEKEGLSFNEIVAQSFVFFLAGFETSSQTISYCIHELAHNQNIQETLRKEIFEKMGKDYRNYSYNDIMTLPYLDKVFNETLRKYPVLGFFNRICIKPYRVPGTDLVIEKGTPVLISVLGLQHDPDYFPNPQKFDPERFSENQTQVPFTFLPFGDGPRFCIGMRYGKLQTKLGIAALVSQFKFSPSPKTPEQVNLDKLTRSLVMIPKEGITVKISKL